ncbi:mucin-2-like [Rhopalosiphum maidis]|uniref:mucin-2-like n=1 Tax=Rhopalosiphum maidis TaxID=43146 RepID=UPI000F002B7E|nr:mucin-2-like [Rhopalosiphum maidis]
MTPFGIILVIAVFSTQVMQTITQPKKYRCASFRPLPQPESEPISSFYLRLPPLSATKSQSTTTKSPAASGSKSPVSVIKSQSSASKSSSSIPKSPSSVSKSSSLITKPSSTVQKVTNSSRTANKSTPDSFSLFKLPLQLISSLLVPMVPSTIRQNTSTVISPQFNFQMPLTFSTVHQPKYTPSDTNISPVPCNTNNLSTPCNSLPGNTNILPNPCNSLPGNTNTLPNPCNSLPGNTNILPNPCNSPPGITNTIPNPCNSLPGNTNTLPNPCNSLPGNTNTLPNPCNTLPGNTNTLPNTCNSTTGNNINNSNYVFCTSLLGNSHKSIIYNWICNYLLNKIQNVNNNTPPIKCISTSTEPNPPVTDNPTVTPIIPTDSTVTSSTEGTTSTEDTPTEDTPTGDTPITEVTPKDNSTPNINISTTTLVPPCTLTTRFHKPCLPPIHHIPKPKPCSLPAVTNSHSHTSLNKHHCPLHHTACPPSHAHFHPLLNPTTYKSNTELTSPQEEILLKIIKSLISNSNLQSPSKSK